MTEKKIIDTAWRSYAEQIIPVNAPDVQRQELRRAFYAGAASMFGGIMAMLEPGTEPTDADLENMNALQGELDQYVRDLKAGRA